MNVYIDLSILNYFLNSIISLFLIKNLSLKVIKFYYFIICMLILCMGWKGFSQIISKIYIRKKGKI